MTTSFLKEFKAFILKGDALNIAIGVAFAAAFNKVITSLVNDIMMPPLGLFIGGVDFRNLKLTLRASQAVTINYGQFINTLIDFLIVAFSIFLMIKFINQLRDSSTMKGV